MLNKRPRGNKHENETHEPHTQGRTLRATQFDPEGDFPLAKCNSLPGSVMPFCVCPHRKWGAHQNDPASNMTFSRRGYSVRKMLNYMNVMFSFPTPMPVIVPMYDFEARLKRKTENSFFSSFKMMWELSFPISNCRLFTSGDIFFLFLTLSWSSSIICLYLSQKLWQWS